MNKAPLQQNLGNPEEARKQRKYEQFMKWVTGETKESTTSFLSEFFDDIPQIRLPDGFK